MAFNGSGVFQRLYSWVNDAAGGIKIRADRMDNEMNGMAVGLSTCITKDGQTTITANLPMAGFRHTGVGNGSARNDYASLAQVQDGKTAWVDGGGTADAITATYSPVITTPGDGQLCYVRATAANLTTTPTFSPNALPARTIVKNGGTALAAGDIAGDGHELILRYDLTNTRWELLNPKTVSSFVDSVFRIEDNVDPTKKIAFQASSVSTGQTRTIGMVDADISLLISPWPHTIAGPTTFRTFTFPDANTTMVGTATTQTLTNKTLTTPTINQGNLVGTTTNDNAAAGSVGEYVEASLAAGSATSLTTATPKTIISISLTAGDWDVNGVVRFVTAGSTTTSNIACGISIVNNTFPSEPDPSVLQLQCSFATNSFNAIPAGTVRMSLAATTTVYLVASSNFAVSTTTAYGMIRARRVR